MEENKTILEHHKNSLEILGFWDETSKNTLITSLLNIYNTETIKEYFIDDLIIKDEKVLVKWMKRFKPLTKEELKEKWNR